jgi:hypothetical protein
MLFQKFSLSSVSRGVVFTTEEVIKVQVVLCSCLVIVCSFHYTKVSFVM